MRRFGLLPLSAGLVCLASLPAAVAAPSTFTVTASNVTMPGGKAFGSTNFTLSSINGYAGRLVISCSYAGAEMNARVPTCGSGTSPLFPLIANQSVHGSLTLVPYGTVTPWAALNPAGNGAPLALSLLVFGISFFGVRRLRQQRVLMLAVTAVLLAGFTSCGGGSLSGSFPYAVTATDSQTGASVSTSITVTVP